MKRRGPLRRIRAATSDDLALILDSWKRSFRDSRDDGKRNDLIAWVPDHIYWPEMQARMTRLIRDAKAMCAVNDSDDCQVFGWCVFVPPNVAHYVYVKEPFRRCGLATELLAEAFGGGALSGGGAIYATHWTRHADWLKLPLRYRPSLLEQ